MNCHNWKYHILQIRIGNPLDTRRCNDVKSTSMTLIQRRNNVVCPVGMKTGYTVSKDVFAEQ